MPLDQIEAVGQRARLGLKDRNAGLGPARIDLRKVVVALAKAVVDQTEITGGIQHIAKGGKGLGGQGLRCDVLHKGRVAKLGGAGKGVIAPRSHPFQRQRNPLPHADAHHGQGASGGRCGKVQRGRA